ncbi:polysaccharide biosynthesis/export family protein [Sphingomonas oryzagri]
MIDTRFIRAILFNALSTAAFIAAGSAMAASSGDVDPTAIAAVSPVENGYRLGAGDKIRISVYGEDGMTGEYLVSETGTISFPLIGDFPVGNRTVSETREALQERLSRGIVNNPRVSAQILSFRPFYILGEINRPGQYPYSIGLTINSAVATAQGFTYRASTRKVMITHAGEGIERAVRVQPGTRIMPGDTVRVVEKIF